MLSHDWKSMSKIPLWILLRYNLENAIHVYQIKKVSDCSRKNDFFFEVLGVKLKASTS
jgi:hypothetical protein